MNLVNRLFRQSLTGAFAVALAFSVGASAAQADEIEGVVRVAGSAASAYVYLAQGAETKGDKLCSTDLSKRVRKLSGLTVRVSGSWKADAKGERECFEGDGFTPLKSSSGKDLVVGTLAQAGGAWTITGADGKAMALADVPAGLKKLDGQQVIVSVNAVSTPGLKESGYKIVTYLGMP